MYEQRAGTVCLDNTNSKNIKWKKSHLFSISFSLQSQTAESDILEAEKDKQNEVLFVQLFIF